MGITTIFRYGILGLLLASIASRPLSVDAQQPSFPPQKPISYSGNLPIASLTGETTESYAPPFDNPSSIDRAVDWHRIVFQAYTNDNWEIYLTDPGGGNPTNISNNPYDDNTPRLNQELSRIVFTSNRDGNAEIYTMNIDGGNVQRLTSDKKNDYSPNWSPEGDRIAFVSDRTGSPEIYAMNADGSGLKRLTDHYKDDINPSWSPDGTKISWIRYDSTSQTGHLRVMNANGSSSQSLTGSLGYLQHSVWSPDGTSIAFDGDINNDFWSDLSIYNLLDHSQKVVKRTNRGVDILLGGWSADGQWLLVSRAFYALQNYQWVLDAARVGRYTLDGSYIEIINSFRYALFPHWQTVDRLPPTAFINPLPAYSRAMGFPVSYWGVDEGPSGVQNYDLEYREVVTGWTSWLTNTAQSWEVFSTSPGKVLKFRVRARDDADNVQDWGSAPETNYTRTYTWELDGTVTDARGNPLAQVAPLVAPSPLDSPLTDVNGKYQAHLTTEGNHNLSATPPGYTPVIAQPLIIEYDQIADFYLTSGTNLIQNGGFEQPMQPLFGWQVEGSLPITPTTRAHMGTSAALLGGSCNTPPCLTGSPFWRGEAAKMAKDEQGNLHVLYGGFFGLFYSVLDTDGNWSTPFQFSNVTQYLPTFDLGFDDQGTLHAVWGDCYYVQKPPGGEWTQPIHPGCGGRPNFVIDSYGVLHLLAQEVGGMGTLYRQRLPNGEWTSPMKFPQSRGLVNDIVLAPDGSIQVFWLGGDYLGTEVYHQTRFEDGSWSSPVLVASNKPQGGIRFLSAAIGTDGWLYVFFTNMFVSRDPHGNWETPLALPVDYNYGELAVDGDNTVHLVGATPQGIYYQTLPHAGTWSSPIQIDPDGAAYYYNVIVTILTGRDNLVHILPCWRVGVICKYYSSSPAELDGKASLSQAVTLSDTVHKPTLAFDYRLTATIPGHDSGLQVLVSDSITTTQVFFSSISNSWMQGWADLQPWSGETITVTFQLKQNASDPLARLALDNISISPWLTPLIKDVFPRHLELNVPSVITITGENFISTPTIQIGGSADVQAVEWKDEQTLRVWLRASSEPGILDLWVTNPGGQVGYFPNAISRGRLLYLPMVIR